MSASLQYSNYSEKAAFTIPYEILFSEQRYIDLYLKSCLSDLRCYQELCSVGFHHDSGGYALPHALYFDFIPSWLRVETYDQSANLQEKYRRNKNCTFSDIWQKLYEFDPVLFSPKRPVLSARGDVVKKVLCPVEFLSQKNGLHYNNEIIILARRRELPVMKIKLIDFGLEKDHYPFRPHEKRCRGRCIYAL